MMSSWSGWRSTMVCAGWPSSQRNNPGAVTQTLPVATSGWARTLSERVWVKSADQLCRLVCAANQRLNWTSRRRRRREHGRDYTQCSDGASGESRNLPVPLNHNLTLNFHLNLRQREKTKIGIKIKKTECSKERIYASFGQMGTN